MPLKFGLVILGIIVGATVNGWRLGAQMDEQTAKYDRERLAHTSATLAATQAAQLREAVLAKKLADVDKTRTAENRTAQNEINTLRNRLAAGTVGLRVNATCPDAGPVIVPGAADRSGVDTGTAPRLTADAESAYIALREGIETQRVQLGACVDALTVATRPR